MLRFQKGDRAAFEQLFERYSTLLVSFLARMVPDRGRAEELAQEVFVRIHQARSRYQPRAKFSTYLFGIAHNLALNELDRAYRKRETVLEDHAAAQLDSKDPPAEELLDGQRTARRLEAGLAKLPERQRAALLLRSREGMSYSEIAKALGASPSGVKSLIHRARAGLLEILERERR